MAKEDVERLRRGYEAFNEGGVEAILDWLDPDIEVKDRQSLPDRATYQGVEAVAALFASNMEVFDQLTFEPEEFIELNNHTVVVLRQRARGRVSGAEVESVIAHLWEMEGGLPVRLRIFGDKEQALEAAEAVLRERGL
jgi:ketosteroid isomerase-like protein